MAHMDFLRNLFLVVTLVFGTANIGECQLLADLSPDVVADITTILVDGTVRLLGNCTGSDNSAPETNYWIYTKDNPHNAIVVTKPSAGICSERKRIIFLAHGWSWDANAPHIIAIKDEYLIRYEDDVCIISVNWGAYAQQKYQSAFCAARGVANNIANFVCNLQRNVNVDPNTLHLVGHSMGAQIFGIAGSLVQARCGKKIGRITGLDPAGPLFNGISKKNRLDSTDALFVDVIHTNVGQYGYIDSIGHLDSFPNCGYFQPGCLEFVLANNSIHNIESLISIGLDLISCNHRRSCDYFQESINSNISFMGAPCDSCGSLDCKEIASSERKVIGEDCTSPGEVQNYVFGTNSEPPYAMG